MVVVSVVAVVLYKVISRVRWFKQFTYGELLSSVTASVLNSISILLLGKMYKVFAYKLTDWGMFHAFLRYDQCYMLI